MGTFHELKKLFRAFWMFGLLQDHGTCSNGECAVAGISQYCPAAFIGGASAKDNATIPASQAPDSMNCAACEIFSPGI